MKKNIIIYFIIGLILCSLMVNTVNATTDKLYERSITPDDVADVYGAVFICQTFTTGVSGTNEIHILKNIALLLSSTYATPTGTAYVKIYLLDGAGKPTGAALSTGSLNINVLTGTPTYYNFSMSVYTIHVSDVHGLVLSFPTGAGSNVIKWSDDLVAPSYTGGNMVYSTDSGATWTVYTAYDLCFKEWGYIPVVSSENKFKINLPANNSRNLCPCCNIFDVSVLNTQGELMSLSFVSNITGKFESFLNVDNGTYSFCSEFPNTFNKFGYTYKWKLFVNSTTDNNESSWQFFTITTDINCSDDIDAYTKTESDNTFLSALLNIDPSLLFLGICLSLWVFLVSEYIKNRTSKSRVMLSLLCIMFSVPLAIQLGILATAFLFGYVIVVMLPIFSIYLFVDSLQKGKK